MNAKDIDLTNAFAYADKLALLPDHLLGAQAEHDGEDLNAKLMAAAKRGDGAEVKQLTIRITELMVGTALNSLRSALEMP